MAYSIDYNQKQGVGLVQCGTPIKSKCQLVVIMNYKCNIGMPTNSFTLGSPPWAWCVYV